MEKKKELNYKWIYFGIAFLMLVFMIYYSDIKSFWYDEVYQLGLVRKELSLSEIFRNYYTLGDYTPPLFALLAAFLVRVFPFVNAYLLIVSEVAVAAGVYLLGVIGEKVKNKLTGVLAVILSGTSYMLIVKAGHEFRAYGLLFFVSVLTLYTFIIRYQKQKECPMKYHLFYGASLILLVYTHYYGAVVCGAFFFFDAFLFLKKRVKLSAIIPYLMAGFSFAPWLLLVLLHHESSMTSFWVAPPNWRTVIDVLKFFASNNEYLFMIMIFALVLSAVRMIVAMRKKTFDYEKNGIETLLLWLILFVMGTMYLYGAVINPGGGIFVHRYFFCIFPCFVLLMAMALDAVICWIDSCKKIPYLGVIACSFLFLYFGAANYNAVVVDTNSLFEPYEESAKELSKKGDISNEKTVILMADCEYVKEGYRYYFEKKGKVTKVNLLSQHEDDFENKLLQYDKIYFMEGHEDITKKTKRILKKNYKKIYSRTKHMISAYLQKDLYDIKYKDREEAE